MTDIELVTSLEKSKELKEAGFPQDKSYFVWVLLNKEIRQKGKWQKVFLKTEMVFPRNDSFVKSCFVEQIIAAPTLAEILAELPNRKGNDEYLEMIIPTSTNVMFALHMQDINNFRDLLKSCREYYPQGNHENVQILKSFKECKGGNP